MSNTTTVADSFIVHAYNDEGKFLLFKTFDKNISAIQYADMFSKFRIYKSTKYGVVEIEHFGFR